MLRITQSTSAAGAQRYYTESLSRQDYYTREGAQEISGQWHGQGAERLRLTGAVTKDAFFALTENAHPETGEQLTPRMKDGRRVGYDFTFSAPKSVSILQALSGDKTIIEAFQSSVHETMREIERDMQTRVRKDGACTDRATGNMVWADFTHFTTRPVEGTPDPDLHMHCFAFNATWDHAEQRWKAGEFGEIKRDAGYYEAAFHARLAHRMQALGFGIARTGKEGKYWDIEGIPRSLIETFSRRTAHIEAKAAELGITDPDIKAGLGAVTRDHKASNCTMGQLRDGWRERMTTADWHAYHTVWEQASDSGTSGASPEALPSWGQWLKGLWPSRTPVPLRTPAQDPGQTITAHDAMGYAVAHEFTRASVVRDRQLRETALRYGVVGGVLPEEVQRQVDAGQHGMLTATVDKRRLVTTRDVHAEEQAMLAFARQGRGSVAPLGLGHPVSRSSHLNAGQQAAVRHALTSHDRVMMIRGHAGTGKTTLMHTAVPEIERVSGKKVFTFAPWSEAARGTLRDEGFREANTVEHMLTNATLQQRMQGQVIWIDEAGQLGTRDMRRVFALADHLDCRVILAGDPAQHSSINRGDSLRLLESHGGLRPAVVSEIVRQKGAYKEAASLLARGDTLQGFDTLDNLGWVIEEPDAEKRYAMLAKDYATSVKAGKSLLVVAPSHREGREVAGAIREELRHEGIVKGPDRPFFTLRNLQWTDAQKGDAAIYRPGLVVQFVQHATGMKNGSRWQVARVEGGKVWLTGTDGGEVLLPHTLGSRFTVFEPETMQLAIGDPVRITFNGSTEDGRHRLNTGAVYAVKGFTAKGDVIITDAKKKHTSWVMPADYAHVTTGYYATSHAAQSKTVDRVLIAHSATSFPASSQEQAYVSATRGREYARIYTDEKEALREHIIRSSQRGSATELLGQELASTTQPREVADNLQRTQERLRRQRKRERRHEAIEQARQQDISTREHRYEASEQARQQDVSTKRAQQAVQERTQYAGQSMER